MSQTFIMKLNKLSLFIIVCYLCCFLPFNSAWSKSFSSLSNLSVYTGIGGYSPEVLPYLLDSLDVVSDSLGMDSLATTSQPVELKTQERLSPSTVVLYSAILPGFGQIYNESYWKLPILYGLMGWYTYNVVQKHDKYIEYRDLYRADPEAVKAESYRSYRDFYRDSRDAYFIYLLLTYLGGLVDAYVDAHLYDFDVGDDLSKQSQKQLNYTPILTFKIEF